LCLLYLYTYMWKKTSTTQTEFWALYVSGSILHLYNVMSLSS
jgi:hypothetical protein